ncbi:MAG: HNH nuclease [Bacteriophage sp.]|nr:MAG: HNH nuclease [Bacteriophage sp.]
MSIRATKGRQRVPPAMAALVARRWGNECWLRFPGCTGKGTTTDHITPFVAGGLTVPSNLRRACKHCNSLRGDRVLSGWGATIHAVIGPPQGGKSSWVRAHALDGDIVLDMDVLAMGLLAGVRPGAEHVESGYVRKLASAAWYGAYRHAVRIGQPVGVWLVKTMPTTPHSPRLLDEWVSLGYDIHVCDPGKAMVMERQRAAPRPHAEAGIKQWYRTGLTQESIDVKMMRRHEHLLDLGLIAGCRRQGRPDW